ncbi:MAG: response regulator [Pseudomonadota bacterium]|nr:response regulator [Pseudomonadota bacterium]
MSSSVATTVFIVDDEEAVADSIAMLLRSVGMTTRLFRDPRAFLEGYRSEQAGCLILDVRMPRMSGLELQQEMIRRHLTLPIIFITGHGDVPMAVEAMRAGAVDFLQKPFNDEELIRRVHKALEIDRHERELLRKHEELARRWAELTAREQEVAQRIADGKANKVVAQELDISERTVEVHRARLLQKLGVRSLAQLVQVVLSLRTEQAGTSVADKR